MAESDEFWVKDASGNTHVPAERGENLGTRNEEPYPDPFGYGSKIVPGHPLYAQVEGERVIADVLRQVLRPTAADLAARAIIASLVRHDPPIYLCTEAEMKET